MQQIVDVLSRRRTSIGTQPRPCWANRRRCPGLPRGTQLAVLVMWRPQSHGILLCVVSNRRVFSHSPETAGSLARSLSRASRSLPGNRNARRMMFGLDTLFSPAMIAALVAIVIVGGIAHGAIGF